MADVLAFPKKSRALVPAAEAPAAPPVSRPFLLVGESTRHVRANNGAWMIHSELGGFTAGMPFQLGDPDA